MHSNLCLVLNKWVLLKKALKEVSFFLPWAKKSSRISLLGDFGYYHIQATRPDTIGIGRIYIILYNRVTIFLRIFIRIETFFRNTEKNLHLFLEFFIYVNSETF